MRRATILATVRGLPRSLESAYGGARHLLALQWTPTLMSSRTLVAGRIALHRVGEILAEAAAEASETLRKSGLPPLPRVAPPGLRRTYISMALLTNNFDIKLGHEPGRTRRLEDDTRCLRPTRATRQV